MMEITIQGFLQKKGAVGLLSLLHERPMSYSEIESEIEVVSDTILERRDEAAELGLLDVSLGEGEVGTRKVYHLTDMGEALTRQMAQTGLVSNYRKMRTLEQLVDEQTGEVVRWVGDNPAQLLMFEEAIDGTIVQQSSQSASSGTDEPNPTGEMANETASESGADDIDDTGVESSEADDVEPVSSTGPDENTQGGTDTGEEATSDQDEIDSEDTESRPQRPGATIEEKLDNGSDSNLDQQNLADIGSDDEEPDSEDRD